MKNIIIIILLVVLVGGGIWFLLRLTLEEPIVKEPTVLEIPPDPGVDIPPIEDIIQVVFPKGGEELEIGKTYEIRWENYIGDEPLNIGLQVTTPDEKVYLKWIDINVPAAPEGTYSWTVTSEPTDSKYKIEVYPSGDRPLVGRSEDFFSIAGDSLVTVNNPNPLGKIASPIRIKGQARRIFSEGEFVIRLRPVGSEWDEDRGIGVKFPHIAEVIALAKTGDWMAGEWCDFDVELSFDARQIRTLAVIELYQRSERLGERLIYEFPVSVSE